jgi:hypothetical protein
MEKGIVSGTHGKPSRLEVEKIEKRQDADEYTQDVPQYIRKEDIDDRKTRMKNFF